MLSEEPTSSPPPRRSPGRIAAFVLLVLAGVVVIAFLAGSLWLNSYLRGDSFRRLLNQKTSAALRAEGEYMPFGWEGLAVHSDGFAARGRPGGWFRELRADQIRAEFVLRGVLERAWQVDNLTIQKLRLTLGEPTGQADASPAAPPAAPASTRVRPPWVPDRFELLKAEIQEANLQWDVPGGPSGEARGVRLMVEPADGGWIIEARDGRLQPTGWPAFDVHRAKLLYQRPRLFLNDSELGLADGGTVNATGGFEFGVSDSFALQAEFRGITATTVLPADWRARLTGKLRGHAKATGPLTDARSVVASGTVRLEGGRLEALPVLDRIAAFTRTEQFKRFALQEASAEFTWTGSKLVVTQLRLESEGLLRVEGSFVVERRMLEGRFEVGVTPSSLRWLPGSQSRVFTVERDGYLWTTMRLTGPLDRLQEDLSPRLLAAAQSEVVEGVQRTVEQGARELLDLLSPLVK
jgi:hypothetical protein